MAKVYFHRAQYILFFCFIFASFTSYFTGKKNAGHSLLKAMTD